MRELTCDICGRSLTGTGNKRSCPGACAKKWLEKRNKILKDPRYRAQQREALLAEQEAAMQRRRNRRGD